LRLAAETAFRYDRCIVIEQEIAGREVQVGVMGNDEPNAPSPANLCASRLSSAMNRNICCANSAAAIRFPEYALDMVRVGASLYGILPMDAEIARTIPLRLMPTFSLHTVITHIKQVAPGETVGYDGSYTARETEWIATLPIEYADGWFRGYRGFHVQVNGAPAPIVGNICMNQTMIRLPCKMPVGTKVTLIGAGPNGYVSLDALAAHAGTIPQQVLTMISERIPKIYIDA
jgi:alanine racemase